MQFINSMGEDCYVYELSESGVERIESLRLPDIDIFFNPYPINKEVDCFVVPSPTTIMLIEGEKEAKAIIDGYREYMQNIMELAESSIQASYYYAFAWKNLGVKNNQFLIMMGQGDEYEYFASRYLKQVELQYQNVYSSFVNIEDFYMPEDFGVEARDVFLNSIDNDYQDANNIQIWDALQNQTPEVYSVLIEKNALAEHIDEALSKPNVLNADSIAIVNKI